MWHLGAAAGCGSQFAVGGGGGLGFGVQAPRTL